jgi:hypothetical protein
LRLRLRGWTSAIERVCRANSLSDSCERCPASHRRGLRSFAPVASHGGIWTKDSERDRSRARALRVQSCRGSGSSVSVGASRPLAGRASGRFVSGKHDRGSFTPSRCGLPARDESSAELHDVDGYLPSEPTWLAAAPRRVWRRSLIQCQRHSHLVASELYL